MEQVDVGGRFFNQMGRGDTKKKNKVGVVHREGISGERNGRPSSMHRSTPTKQ